MIYFFLGLVLKLIYVDLKMDINEIIFEILSYCEPEDIFAFSLVSHKWYNIFRQKKRSISPLFSRTLLLKGKFRSQFCQIKISDENMARYVPINSPKFKLGKINPRILSCVYAHKSLDEILYIEKTYLAKEDKRDLPDICVYALARNESQEVFELALKRYSNTYCPTFILGILHLKSEKLIMERIDSFSQTKMLLCIRYWDEILIGDKLPLRLYQYLYSKYHIVCLPRFDSHKLIGLFTDHEYIEWILKTFPVHEDQFCPNVDWEPKTALYLYETKRLRKDSFASMINTVLHMKDKTFRMILNKHPSLWSKINLFTCHIKGLSPETIDMWAEFGYLFIRESANIKDNGRIKIEDIIRKGAPQKKLACLDILSEYIFEDHVSVILLEYLLKIFDLSKEIVTNLINNSYKKDIVRTKVLTFLR